MKMKSQIPDGYTFQEFCALMEYQKLCESDFCRDREDYYDHYDYEPKHTEEGEMSWKK